MKILYLTFYYEPDLCAGSFRNTTLSKELAGQCKIDKCDIDVITTMPNRYSTFKVKANSIEKKDNIKIYRVDVPSHNSGIKDQIISFRQFYSRAKKITSVEKYDLVFASSSRLFTAYLGYRVAKKQNIPLYLDIRDIFVDTINDVLKNRLLKKMLLPVLKNIENKTFSYANHINLISEGFKPYFSKYKKANYSFFTNGIDDIFLEEQLQNTIKRDISHFRITYAGNIGEGQGLHKIIPQVAEKLGEKYQFSIIGDGGAKQLLLNEIKKRNLKNVEIKSPVSRDKLIESYNKSDFLFIHLNNYKAFEKVLPSKIFELASYDKPIIAGVGGYANKFIAENVTNKILFMPCDVESMVESLKMYKHKRGVREEFLTKYSRKQINNNMSKSILSYL